MAGRLLANLIVVGGTVVGRAVLQAYRQSIVNANKTGAAQEAISGIRKASKAMTEQEARQILGINEKSTWEEIVQKYDTMFERNAKNGSFYLQSKILTDNVGWKYSSQALTSSSCSIGKLQGKIHGQTTAKIYTRQL